MSIQFTTRSDLNTILKKAYNPPQIRNDIEKKKFHDEYWRCHAQVKKALEILGKHDDFGDGDFAMNGDWYLSRGISIEITSEKLICPELAPLIQHCLEKLPEKYSVYVDHALSDLALFFMFIESDKIQVVCNDSMILKRLDLANKNEATNADEMPTRR